MSYAAEKYRSRDAAALGVKHHPQYRFDIRLRSDLEDAINLADLDEMKREGVYLLASAEALAVKTADGEINRMPPEGIEFLASRYYQGGGAASLRGAACRQAVRVAKG